MSSVFTELCAAMRCHWVCEKCARSRQYAGLVIDVSHSLSGRYWCCGERITHVRLKLRVCVIVLRCVHITLIYGLRRVVLIYNGDQSTASQL